MEGEVDQVQTYDDVFCSNGHDHQLLHNNHAPNDTYEDIDDVIARMGPLPTEDQHVYANLEQIDHDKKLPLPKKAVVNKPVGSQPKSRQDTYAKYIKSTLGDTNNNISSVSGGTSHVTNHDLDGKHEKRLPVDGNSKQSVDDWASVPRDTNSLNSKQSVTQTSSSDDAEVDKMTTCPICSQMFTNPKMLPCLHTFCLSCLEQSLSADSQADCGLVACSVCQVSFQIPSGGLCVLPTNSLFARITEVRRSISLDSSQSQSVSVHSMPTTPVDMDCSLCAEGSSSPPQAAFKCIDCNGDLLCTDCATAHRKQRMSKSHKLVSVDPGLSNSPMCPLHELHPIESYCVNCLSPVCKLCRDAPRGGLAGLKSGCQHLECVALSAMAQSSRKQLEEDVGQLKQMTHMVQGLVTSITLQRQTFLAQIDEVKKQINDAAETATLTIEKNRQQLIDENDALRTNTIRELDKLADDITVSSLQLDELRQLSCQLLKCGDDADIAGLYGRLSTQRQYLQQVQARHDISVCGVKFLSEVPSLPSERSNMLGKLVMLDTGLSDHYAGRPTIIHTFPAGKTIAGVTVLDKELFVLRDQQPNVEVYDAIAPYTGQKRLTIPGLRWPSDIAASPTNNRVYIADLFGCVYIFDPSGNTFNKFNVDGEPQGLFVTGTTIYVTGGNSRTIKEFTLDGEPTRTVRMQTDILRPYHSVPLIDSGRYVVCHGTDSGKLHRVCVLDSSGKVNFFYGNANGSGSGRLDVPCHLHVDQFGYVLVVDRNNDRIVLLSPNLIYIRDLINRSFPDFKQPRRMWFDASSGLLYVGLLTGRVIVVRISNGP